MMARNMMVVLSLSLVSAVCVHASQQLRIAAATGNLEQVKSFLQAGHNVNGANGKTGMTALLLAAHAGHRNVVQELLNAGADITQVNVSGRNVVHVAARAEHAKLLERDIIPVIQQKKAGYLLNSTDAYQQTPLHYALRGTYPKTAMTLVRNGADINIQIEGGLTPIQIAAQRGDTKLVGDLYGRGAVITQKVIDAAANQETRDYLENLKAEEA